MKKTLYDALRLILGEKANDATVSKTEVDKIVKVSSEYVKNRQTGNVTEVCCENNKPG